MPYIPLKVCFRPPEIAKLALFRPKMGPFCQKPPNWRFSLKNRQISPEIVKFGNFVPKIPLIDAFWLKKIARVAFFRQKTPNRRFFYQNIAFGHL